MHHSMRSIIFLVFLLFSFGVHAAIDPDVGRNDVQAYTGSFNYSIPIPVAPGVAGVQPALALNYSSGTPNGLYGQGWKMGLSHIERSVKTGKPTYTDADTFVLVMNGAQNTLLHVGGDQYRVRNEGLFLRITKAADHWIVRDKSGSLYYFGLNNMAQNSQWPAAVAQPFSWSLSSVVDPRGESIHYFYANDTSGHRLLRIEYSPNNRVDFVYEARSDVQVSHTSGHEKRTAVRLRHVKSWANGFLSYHQEFQYSALNNDNRSLLVKAIQWPVVAGPSAQVRTFNYADHNLNDVTQNWKTSTKFNVMDLTNNRYDTYYTRYNYDMNGDGSTDFITPVPWFATPTGSANGKATSFTFYIYGQGYGSFAFPNQGSYYTTSVYTRVKESREWVWKDVITRHEYDRAWIDMNGDGMKDWVVKNTTADFLVYYANGDGGWSAPVVWLDPESGDARKTYSFFDVNGDGLPDRMSGSTAWLNTGEGFGAAIASSVPAGANAMTAYIAQVQVYAQRQWSRTPLMISTRNESTKLLQRMSYSLQNVVGAPAPGMKVWTVSQVATGGAPSNIEYRSTRYTYNGGLFNLATKEFRGFKTVIAADEQTNITTTTNYLQDLIFQGRASDVTVSLNGITLSTSASTWLAKSYNTGQRNFPYVANSTSSKFEVDGFFVSSTTTENSYNDLGNLTTSTVSSGGFATTTANTYETSASCSTIPEARTRMVEVTTTVMVAETRTGLAYTYVRRKISREWVWVWEWVPYTYTVMVPYTTTSLEPETYYVQIPDPECSMLGAIVRTEVTSTSPTDAVGKTRTSSFAYTATGQIQSESIEPDNALVRLTSDYTYDSHGNRLITTISGSDIVTRSTTVAYDANGLFPVSTINTLGHVESYTWDARFGVKSSLTGPNGLTTSWQYDGFGKKVAEVRADGTRSDITYHLDVAPFYVLKQSTGSPASITYYDAKGRETRIENTLFDGTLAYVDTEYDALGRVARKSLPHKGTAQGWTTYSYDAIGRTISATAPDASMVTTSYNGLTTTGTNAKGQQTITVKDFKGNVVSITDHLGGVMRYAYDAQGNLTDTTDASGNITSMSYDVRGRKTSMNDPDMGIWSYQYDVQGNLIGQTDAKNQSTIMTYDALSRLVSRTEPEGVSTWVYDTLWIGGLTSESGPLSSKTYSYDTLGRVTTSITTVNGQNFAVDSTYDALNRVDTITYPQGSSGNRFAVKQNYNAQGFMASVSNATTGAVIWQANTVNEFGHTTSESFGNGVVTTRVYDSLRGVMTGMQSVSGASTIQSWSYDHDAVGNMLFRTDNVMGYTENFGYDGLNRLASVTGPSNKTYAYDAIGNITSKSDVGVYTYDVNHPHAVATAGGNNYAYDANGNMLSGAGRTLSWTSFNKPLGVTTANGYTGYTYDANHNRIAKATPSSTTIYIGKMFEQITMGVVIKDINHIYVGSTLVVSIEDVGGVIAEKYMHADHLGSINVITDNLGVVLERLSFDAFGKPRNVDATDSVSSVVVIHTTRGYTGHEMDAESGLINMNARLYDPVLGRFISADTVVPDPGDMQGFNRYSYVKNNPLIYTDPTGHWWHIAIGAIIGAVSAAANGGGIDDIIIGAVIGAVAAAVATPAASWASSAAGGGVTGFVAGGVVGGIAGGIAGAVIATAAYGGKIFTNIKNGAISGAASGFASSLFGQWAGAYVAGYWQGGSDDARRSLGNALMSTFVAFASYQVADFIDSDVAATGREQNGNVIEDGGDNPYDVFGENSIAVAALSSENGGVTSDVGGGLVSSKQGDGYSDRYFSFIQKNLIQLTPKQAVALIVTGAWPKSLVPYTNGRPSAFGNKNPLTSVPRAFRIPAGKIIGRFATPILAPVSVGIGMYNATILLEGFVYAIE